MLRVIARIWFPAVLSAAAVAPACASDHFSIERVGDKVSDGGEAVSWCQVKEVLSQRCWRCHHKDPENDAPFQLCRYADTQAVFFGDLQIWEEMQNVVSIDFMPPVKLLPDLLPPVQPLDTAQKQTLLDWFAQGAPMGGAGGASGTTDPPCGGPVDTIAALCLSGKPFAEWTGAGGGAAGAGGTANGGGSGAGAGGASGAGTAGAGG